MHVPVTLLLDPSVPHYLRSADQYFDSIPPEHQYNSNRRGGPQFLADDAYGDRYDRVDAYMMQQQAAFPQRQAYGGRVIDNPAPRTMQGPGRMMDRGGRALPAQQRAGKGAGFNGPAHQRGAAAAPADKSRLPQEAYIKRQSLRWLIKQRLQQVLFFAVHPRSWSSSFSRAVQRISLVLARFFNPSVFVFIRHSVRVGDGTC